MLKILALLLIPAPLMVPFKPMLVTNPPQRVTPLKTGYYANILRPRELMYLNAVPDQQAYFMQVDAGANDPGYKLSFYVMPCLPDSWLTIQQPLTGDTGKLDTHAPASYAFFHKRHDDTFYLYPLVQQQGVVHKLDYTKAEADTLVAGFCDRLNEFAGTFSQAPAAIYESR